MIWFKSFIADTPGDLSEVRVVGYESPGSSHFCCRRWNAEVLRAGQNWDNPLGKAPCGFVAISVQEGALYHSNRAIQQGKQVFGQLPIEQVVPLEMMTLQLSKKIIH